MRKFLFLILFLALAGFIGWKVTHKEPLEVELVSVERGLVEATVSNTRTGTVKACRRSRLSLPIGGQVTALNVDVGDEVEKDQLLLELWNVDRKAQVGQSRAALTAAEYRANSVCLASAHDQREAKRLSALFKRKMISEDLLDKARSRSEASRASCKSARSEIEVAQANLLVQEALLEKTVLRAPFKGIVAEVNGELGEYVTPSPPGVATPPAVDLIEANCLYVEAPADEVDAAVLELKLPARITMDAFSGKIFPGRVSRIAPFVEDREKQARTVDVDVRFEETPSDIHLLVGYSADIEVVLKATEDVLRVPTELVLDGEHVLLFDEATGTLNKRKVSVGLQNWSYSEITEGLALNDRIASNVGEKGIVDGAEVVPRP